MAEAVRSSSVGSNTRSGYALKRENRIAELYDMHMTSAVRFAYLLSGDRELSQDLAHEAFLRVATRLGALRSPESFPAYLRSSVFNAYRSHWRRRRRERAYIDSKRHEPRLFVEAPDVETRDQILTALDKLSPRRKAAVILRYYEDLTERETSEILNCSIGAVKALVARGLKDLRIDLEGERDVPINR